MTQQEQPARFRFDCFELDLRTSELRKEGRRVKVQDQPMKLLALLASRAGELVTRGEIQEALWSDSHFVEFEHAINTAMRKIRDALGDDLEKPRFIETLPRKGYRFIPRVEQIGKEDGKTSSPESASPEVQQSHEVAQRPDKPSVQEFSLPRGTARALFLTIQAGYLAMYCAALYYAATLEQAVDRVLTLPAGLLTPLVIVFAMCGIAVRLYLLSAVGLDHPATGVKFRRLFPALVGLDGLWAASPLLVAGNIGIGPALAGVAGLAYLPFSQRTLIQCIYRGEKSTGSGISHISDM
ncbi:MAG: winged helix-turn-helix domain-containing protein [Acidobacteria bacterium]|nr:winged helix-turn-helix domain-containing protein [Acidobacteriota bacterium]